MSEHHLIYNAIRTPDGTVLESLSKHDFKSHHDKVTKDNYFVDGGLAYIRRSARTDFEELSLYDDAPHDKIRQCFKWGTYGPKGDRPLHYIKLEDMEFEHIEAIIRTQTQLPKHIINIFKTELEYRKLN